MARPDFNPAIGVDPLLFEDLFHLPVHVRLGPVRWQAIMEQQRQDLIRSIRTELTRVEMPILRINEYEPYRRKSSSYEPYIIVAFVVVVFCFFAFNADIETSAACLQNRTFKINNIPQIPLPPPPKFDFARDQQSMLSARLIIERMKLPPMSHFKI